jgi:osmotically-inducible protein OsmY
MTQTRHRTDLQLEHAIFDELRWTPSVNSARIRVAVVDGTATLSGEVATYPETMLAAKAALRVRGVRAVAQELAVRGRWAVATDTEIAQHAGDALDRAVDVPDTVKATVRDHDLTLSGEVTWQYQREAACRAVVYVPGIRAMFDAISIAPGAPGSSTAASTAADITADVTAALRRNAGFTGEHLQVTTDVDGVVTLTGDVASPEQSRQAAKACWSGAGVTAVENHLVVPD